MFKSSALKQNMAIRFFVIIFASGRIQLMLSFGRIGDPFFRMNLSFEPVGIGNPDQLPRRVEVGEVGRDLPFAYLKPLFITTLLFLFSRSG
jgi:hypothetical protein